MKPIVGSIWRMRKNSPCTCSICESNKGNLFTLIKTRKNGERIFVTMKSTITGEEISQGVDERFGLFFDCVVDEEEML